MGGAMCAIDCTRCPRRRSGRKWLPRLEMTSWTSSSSRGSGARLEEPSKIGTKASQTESGFTFRSTETRSGRIWSRGSELDAYFYRVAFVVCGNVVPNGVVPVIAFVFPGIPDVFEVVGDLCRVGSHIVRDDNASFVEKAFDRFEVGEIFHFFGVEEDHVETPLECRKDLFGVANNHLNAV